MRPAGPSADSPCTSFDRPCSKFRPWGSASLQRRWRVRERVTVGRGDRLAFALRQPLRRGRLSVDGARPPLVPQWQPRSGAMLLGCDRLRANRGVGSSPHAVAQQRSRTPRRRPRARAPDRVAPQLRLHRDAGTSSGARCFGDREGSSPCSRRPRRCARPDHRRPQARPAPRCVTLARRAGAAACPDHVGRADDQALRQVHDRARADTSRPAASARSRRSGRRGGRRR